MGLMIMAISMGLIWEMTGKDMMTVTPTVIIINSIMMDLMGHWETLLNWKVTKKCGEMGKGVTSETQAFIFFGQHRHYQS